MSLPVIVETKKMFGINKERKPVEKTRNGFQEKSRPKDPKTEAVKVR